MGPACVPSAAGRLRAIAACRCRRHRTCAARPRCRRGGRLCGRHATARRVGPAVACWLTSTRHCNGLPVIRTRRGRPPAFAAAPPPGIQCGRFYHLPHVKRYPPFYYLQLRVSSCHIRTCTQNRPCHRFCPSHPPSLSTSSLPPLDGGHFARITSRYPARRIETANLLHPDTTHCPHASSNTARSAAV